MRNYVLRRLLMLAPLLFGVSVLTFVLLRIAPGDAAVGRAGIAATPERVQEIRRQIGLDKPYFPVSLSESTLVSFHDDSQYWFWLRGVIQGDFGQSRTFQRPVASEIVERLPVTAELLILSGLLTVVMGVPAGVFAAVRRNTALDFFLRTVSVSGLSIPGFWLGTMMLLLPAIWFGWAPPVTYEHIWVDPVQNLKQFILPALALSTASAATIMRLTRSAMLDVLRNDYVRTAWAKGLKPHQVIVRHAIKNAMIPVVTFIGIQLLTLISGAVLIEQLFNLDGLGLLLYTGVFSDDYALVQALVLFIAALVLLTNLAVDLLYGWLDPRIRYA